MKIKTKVFSIITGLALMSLLTSGCTRNEVVTTDREGNEFKKLEKVDRIISTAPSNTEILVGLGLKDNLVAVDNYSYDVEGIDENLIKIDFMNPDIETIISLEPDLIIASGTNVIGDQDPYKLIKETGISVVYIPSSSSLEGIYKDINFIADITNTEERGKEIVENMKKEVESIREIGSKITSKKAVYFEIGSGSQLYSFGNETFLNEMIEIIGAKNIFADESSWIAANPESIIDANPDIILTNVPDMNGVKAIEDIKSRDGWKNINAVKEDKIYGIDTNASSRPSQYVIKALKEMAKAVYPDVYK